MPNAVPTELKGYFDENGMLLRWPAKGRSEKRALALIWVSGHFEPGRIYHERDINAVLKSVHTFSDHAFLRRELIDQGYLTRNNDGSEYRVAGN